MVKLRFYSCFVVFLPVGKNQTKSKEDDLKGTLQSYKKNHRSVYLYLSETEKLIRSLRNFLACGQLATEGAFWKADSLVASFRKVPDETSGAVVVDFLVDVDVPKLLTEVLRSLHQKYPDVFSSEGQVSQKNLPEIFYEEGFKILIEMGYGISDAHRIPRVFRSGKSSIWEIYILTEQCCSKF